MSVRCTRLDGLACLFDERAGETTKVFVSSTSEDLTEYRAATIRGLRRLDSLGIG